MYQPSKRHQQYLQGSAVSISELESTGIGISFVETTKRKLVQITFPSITTPSRLTFVRSYAFKHTNKDVARRLQQGRGEMAIVVESHDAGD